MRNLGQRNRACQEFQLFKRNNIAEKQVKGQKQSALEAARNQMN
jgi:hypothetical protein